MDAKTQATYLDNDLVCSQTFQTLGVGTTTVSVSFGSERIYIEFLISEAANREANQMWAEVVSSDRLQIHIVNLRQIMPPQVLGPSNVGTMAGRPLTILVLASGLGPKNTLHKNIAYSLYLGRPNA